MIAISFIDFFREKFDNTQPYSIYVVRDGADVLYVGTSEDYLWNRWFGGGTSHMRIERTKKGTLVPIANGSFVAERIQLNYPESLQWTIELWTDEDCREFLSKNHNLDNLKRTHDIEFAMIREREPLYNVKGSSGCCFLPRTQKERDQAKKDEAAYNEIFNK